MSAVEAMLKIKDARMSAAPSQRSTLIMMYEVTTPATMATVTQRMTTSALRS